MPAESAEGPVGEWVERWLSPPRFTVYLNAADDDRDAALQLYEWNARLGSALSTNGHAVGAQAANHADFWRGGGDGARGARAAGILTRSHATQSDREATKTAGMTRA